MPGHPVQPIAQDGAGGHGTRLADEDKEGGLEGVLGVGGIAQDTLADAQHHAAVSLQQRRKRRLISIQREALQQLPVAELLRAARDTAKPVNRYFQ